MQRGEVIVRFEKVSFDFGVKKPILQAVDFSIRRGTKITLMGQNGAGKSTIFGLITSAFQPPEGMKNISHAPLDKKIGTFSGGQQARLLLAQALIQNPGLLLLDEPTNNLDKAGIEHLTKFLKEYKKTVIVISHEAAFLNAFTYGVLYLDVHTHKVEQYVGNYLDVVKDITARIEKENRKNALFANKGGQMRMVAKRMREKAAELEEEMVDVRKEDKTIRSFRIPAGETPPG